MEVWNSSGGGVEVVPGGNDSGGPWAPGTVERVLVPILDVLFLVLGVTGHALVMAVLCGRSHRRRRGGGGAMSGTGTGTDVLLVALSASDLLLLSTLPFHSTAVALQRWPFGDFLCRALSFLGAACSSASAFTLAALAVTRYLTVVRPNTAYRLLSPRRVSWVVVSLWVPACALAAPQLDFRSVGTPRRPPEEGLACFAFLSQEEQLALGLCHFLLAFLLPLATIAVAYGGIYVFLWRSRRQGRAPQVERYQSKVTQTSLALVLSFTLCWLPSYGLTLALLASGSQGAAGASPRYGAFSVFARGAAMASTVANPLLYVLMSEKFRRDVLELFRRGRRGEGERGVANGGVVNGGGANGGVANGDVVAMTTRRGGVGKSAGDAVEGGEPVACTESFKGRCSNVTRRAEN